MSVLYTEGNTVSDWLKGRPFDAAYDSEPVEIKSGDNLVSGTVLGEVTATGFYTQCNTAAGDGSQTAKGILVNPVSATGVYATGATGTTTTTGVNYTAVELGASGNDITIVLVNPGADGALSVATTGDAQTGYTITITLAYALGAVTTVSSDIPTLIAGDATASALVVATDDGNGTTVLTADTATLAGGVDYVLTNQGVMLRNLTGCIVYLSKLTYTGSAATIQAALEGLGAEVAIETD